MSRRAFVGFVAVCSAAFACASAHEYGSLDRERVQKMLRDASRDVTEHYYDPRFHGIDWDARVARARADIDKATSLNQAMAHVAGALDSLNDSHTFFLAPARRYRLEYGWRAQMIGDRCLVTRVRPGSDAEAKGLKPGDELRA